MDIKNYFYKVTNFFYNSIVKTQYKRVSNEMQHLLSSLYFTVVFLYMFREPTDDYRITAPTTTFYDMYQWLYMQFLELMMMGAKYSRNM
jgi:hypothetical protein